MTENDRKKNTCQPASEAALDSSDDRYDSSLCKVPHEAVNESAAAKLSHSAFTAFTASALDGSAAASEANLQHGE
ncbi:MAG: hypothetical protein ACHQDF_06875, partial [Chitinophagales bacterium]